ncbi:hypothetical protein V6N12_051938 [Hibiscus sabdariffa]|uniref:Leucine-rich repeat-containing N-terminal plant-type domain-containing protein n=1 Tax=Hibiscus sabdariffa TaxID=183260 RepID=A0ABR2GHC8_9ROSI
MDLRLLRLLLVVLLVGGGWWSHCHGCWDQERTALMHLKPYFDLYVDGVSKWGQRANCCEWAGVHCDISTGRLTRLFLNSSDYELIHGFFYDPMVYETLSGWVKRKEWYLNVSLFLPFQELNTLSLSGQNIAGFVNHQEKGESALSKLEVLDLSSNLFNNSVFSFLGLLPNLKSSNISWNRLEGSIRIKELNALNNLEELIMRHNQVIEFLPSQDDELELRLMNLKALDLFGNPLNSSILASIGRLSNLRSLSLTFGVFNFTGWIDFTELKALTHLEDLTLYLYNDSFILLATDSFPYIDCRLPLHSLGLFPSLKTVALVGFNIEGTIMTSQSNETVLRLMNLKSLTLGVSNFQGSIALTELNGLVHLEDLSLHCYDYDDSSLTTTGRPCSLPLQSLGLFSSLKTVELHGFDIEGTTRTSQSEWHSNFTNLEELRLYNSSLQTNILGSIQQFTSLRRLILMGCEMNESLNILEGLCEMINLQELLLNYNNLKGNLPECFSNLASLETLDLSSNQFSGNIYALKSLASLQNLGLADNHFRIPISLGPFFNLSKLKFISAGNNIICDEPLILSLAPRFQLEFISLSCCGEVGSFPEFLYHQHDLQSLDLSNIFFKGNQFPNWLLDNNTKLERMHLSNSSLSGPLQLPLALHTHLSYLDISNNFFNGSIPTEIGEQLPSLVFLNLSKTQSIGSIPSSFDHMTSLRVLDLSNNKLEGKIFSGNYKLPNLRVLKLDGNNFSGRISDSLSKSPFLLTLDVSNNRLSGMIPRWMGKMSYLERIILANNHLQGTIPNEFCRLDLVFLDLSVNNISGIIPSCFNPSRIRQVYLAKNRLQGTLPNTLCNSSTLVTLDIRENFLGGNIPSWIGRLSNLSFLLLSKNNFQGEIPKQLCNLNHLSMIDFSHNNLSGQIPPCLKLTTLGDVDYVNESMTGTSVFSLDEPIDFLIKNVYNSYRGRNIQLVSGIDLSCNKLVGEIPYQIGNFHKILVLNLSHNSLTGPIPPTFANLKQIESLDLSYNKLSGNIPPQLVELTFLAYFNVSFNNLTGRIPPSVAQFGTFNEDSYRGNPFLCIEPLPKLADTGPFPLEPNSSTDNDEDYGFIDMGEFHLTFIVSYTIMLLTVVVVLYINPYWRRVWFYYAETAISFCYYFVLDNVFPKRFHCENL